jgi:hypothetical protein
MAKIAVIVLAFNQCESSLDCLARLYQSSREAYPELLWDNGSRRRLFELEVVASKWPVSAAGRAKLRLQGGTPGAR